MCPIFIGGFEKIFSQPPIKLHEDSIFVRLGSVIGWELRSSSDIGSFGTQGVISTLVTVKL